VKTVAEDSSVTAAERDAALAKLDVLERSIADMSHPNMRMLVADLEAERVARTALTKAMEKCLQYADSSVAAVTAERDDAFAKMDMLERSVVNLANQICEW